MGVGSHGVGFQTGKQVIMRIWVHLIASLAAHPKGRASRYRSVRVGRGRERLFLIVIKDWERHDPGGV